MHDIARQARTWLATHRRSRHCGGILLPFLLFPHRPDDTAPQIVEHGMDEAGFHATVQREGRQEHLWVGRDNFMFRYEGE